jgi:hypothetical protein
MPTAAITTRLSKVLADQSADYTEEIEGANLQLRSEKLAVTL